MARGPGHLCAEPGRALHLIARLQSREWAALVVPPLFAGVSRSGGGQGAKNARVSSMLHRGKRDERATDESVAVSF